MELVKPIPVEGIEHLDFPVIEEETEEKAEPPKICAMDRPHPHDSEHQPCGRKAYVLITVTDKPCKPCRGHTKTFYVCKGCWTQIQQDPNHIWYCGVCKTKYKPMAYITRWERV